MPGDYNRFTAYANNDDSTLLDLKVFFFVTHLEILVGQPDSNFPRGNPGNREELVGVTPGFTYRHDIAKMRKVDLRRFNGMMVSAKCYSSILSANTRVFL